MKKISFIIGLAMLLAWTSSCKKNENKETSSFSASIESDEGGSRTYLDGYKVRWSAGNQIVVYGNGDHQTYTLTDGAGTQVGTFTTTGGVQPADTYRGFYPAASCTGLSGDVFSFSMPSTQTYTAGGFADDLNPMGAKTVSTNPTVLPFKNAFAVLKLQTTGNRSVTRVELTVPSGNYVYGNYTFDPTTGSTNYVSGGGQTITLNCPTAVALNASTAQDFYIVLPPGSINNGFTVNYFKDSSATPFYTQTVESTATNINLARNTIKRMNVTANAATIQVVNLVPVMEATYWDRWWYSHHCNNASVQVTVSSNHGTYFNQIESGFEFRAWSKHRTVFRPKEKIHLISGHMYYGRFHTYSTNYTGTNQYAFWWPNNLTPENESHSSDTYIFHGQTGGDDNAWYCRSGITTLNVTTGDYYAGIELYSPELNPDVSSRYITGAMLIDLTATYSDNGLSIPSKAHLDGLQYFHTNPMDLSVWDPSAK